MTRACNMPVKWKENRSLGNSILCDPELAAAEIRHTELSRKRQCWFLLHSQLLTCWWRKFPHTWCWEWYEKQNKCVSVTCSRMLPVCLAVFNVCFFVFLSKTSVCSATRSQTIAIGKHLQIHHHYIYTFFPSALHTLELWPSHKNKEKCCWAWQRRQPIS